jgi:copper transporter 1
MHGTSKANACKISMLWNWFTVDACFFSRQWRIKSAGGFAGLCIGVVFLVMLLEAARRSSREYDRYLLRKYWSGASIQSTGTDSNKVEPMPAPRTRFRPTVGQQAIRAMLHMVQFALAYLIMLFAMYYNGYIIISILVGAFLGGLLFTWEKVGVEQPEATVCCG